MENYSNKAGNVVTRTTRIQRNLSSPNDVLGALARAQNEGLGIMAVGRGESTSWALAGSEGCVVLATESLRGIAWFDHPVFPARQLDHDAVWVSAGERVQTVLDALALRKRTLATVGAYSGQSLVGAVLTGTHGSSLRFGVLADLVLAFEVVSFDATTGLPVRRVVQPTPGVVMDGPEVITDPALFEASVVSFGMVGVITAMLFGTVPQFRLLEVRPGRVVPFDELINDWFSSTAPDGQPDRFSSMATGGALIVPYNPGDDRIHCFVSQAATCDTNSAPSAPPDRLPCDTIVKIGERVLAMQSFRDQVKTLVNILHAQQFPTSIFDDSTKVLTSSSGFGSLTGFGTEWTFPISSGGGWRHALIDLVGRLGEQPSSPARLGFLGFISVRFQGPSRALLAHRPGPTVSFEVLATDGIGSIDGINRGREALAFIAERMLELGGLPHWGQVFSVESSLKDVAIAQLTHLATRLAGEIKTFRAAVLPHFRIDPFLQGPARELFRE